MKSYFDIQGDGGSDVLGQVQAQQAAIRQALAGVRQIVAVGSGKGGVGKSTLTLSLAKALATGGNRVSILDADFNGPCQAQMAGVAGQPWVPGERGLALPRRPDGIGVLSMGSVYPNLEPVAFDSVSAGDEHVWRSTREFAVLGQLLGSVDWGELDFLLFDLPPGAERTVQYSDFLGEGVAFVLVTIPSDLSRGVVARSVSALQRSSTRVLGYVENMAGYYCRGCDELRPLFPPSRVELGLPCLGRIPFDPELARLCDEGWPEEADATADRARGAVLETAQRIVRALET